MTGRVDDLRPDQETGEDEAQVLQRVHDRVGERGLVQRRHVPSDEDGKPGDEAHPRREQERERPPQPAHVRERDEQATWQEEDGERPRTATSVSAIPRSATSTCWSMCTDCRYSSPTVSIGPTSAKTVIATPAQYRTARLHGARSGRPRCRSRWKPWKKNASATTPPASTSGEQRPRRPRARSERASQGRLDQPSGGRFA